MIDVRWPQQRYARTAVWAGQRFPLLQRLLARAGDGETPREGSHTGLLYRTARALPVTLASRGAAWPGTAATPFELRRQATPDTSGTVGHEPSSSAVSTANAGPLPDHLAQRATRPPGVIDVQRSRQQVSRTTGEFGQTLAFLKPLLARYDSGRGAETGSGNVRVLAASPARWSATGHDDNDLAPSTAFGDSFVGRPAGEPPAYGQIGRLRSVVTNGHDRRDPPDRDSHDRFPSSPTLLSHRGEGSFLSRRSDFNGKAASAIPEMAVGSTIAGRVDRLTPTAPSTALAAEASPATVGSLRVRRGAVPTAAVLTTRHGGTPSGKTTAHSRQPDDQPSDGVATLAATAGPAAPGARTTTDPESLDRIATMHSPSSTDSATTHAGLRGRLLPDHPARVLLAETAAANRRAVPAAQVAADPPLGAGRQTIAHAAATVTQHERAGDGAVTILRRAAGASIRQPGDSPTPPVVPFLTPGAVRRSASIDDHRLDQAAALPARLATPAAPAAAAIEHPAIGRPSADRGEPVRATPAADFAAATSAWLDGRLPLAGQTFAPYSVAAGSRRILARKVTATRVLAVQQTVDPPFAVEAPTTGNVVEGPGSLPFAYPTSAPHTTEVNQSTPADPAIASALPVIEEKATAAANDRDSAMVWRQRTANSPSPGASTAGILESTRALTAAARPADGGASPASADGQPNPAAPTGDIALPAATVDWDALVAQLSRRIHRQLTIERERRGVKGWN